MREAENHGNNHLASDFAGKNDDCLHNSVWVFFIFFFWDEGFKTVGTIAKKSLMNILSL